MRTLVRSLIPALLLACGPEVPATTEGAAGTTTSTAGATTSTLGDPTGTGDPTTAPTTSGPATASTTTDPTGVPTTTSETDGVTTTTSTTDITTTATTTDAGLCGAHGPEIAAELVHDGEPPGCGTLEFIGQNGPNNPGPIYMLDGCICNAGCEAPDPWTFTIDAPEDLLPGLLPDCPRIVVERQMGEQGCELVGVAIWDQEEPPDLPALYHAGSLLGPIAAAQAELATALVPVETCECANCCDVPTRWDLQFTALGQILTLAEGEESTIMGEELGYHVKNLQSHQSGVCDESPAVDWAMVRVFAP